MASLDLEQVARVCEVAADRARKETLSRFRDVAVEWKKDGSPVTEADRAAERVIREVLRDAYPDFAVLGEEYGREGAAEGPYFTVDPIDGTIGFSRGIALFSTLIALLVDGEPVVGLIDLPGLDERYLGWRGGGCRRNGVPVRCSERKELSQALISHGDPYAFTAFGERPAFDRMASELSLLRGYTDAFGHAQVLHGGVDAMVDLCLNPWDAAATQVLVPEAGGRCVTLERKGTLGLVMGSAPLVEKLLDYLETHPG